MQKFRTDLDEKPLQPADSDDKPTTSEGLAQARSASERLLAAGDEAIRRALAGGNSEAFLQATRQQSGE
jgi:hypothetical protein